MKVVTPIKLDVLESTVAETDDGDGVLWNASTNYAKNARVRYEHNRYISLADSNKGNTPQPKYSDPLLTKWRNLGPTNRYALIDDTVGTQTVATGATSMRFVMPFNRCTSFGLLNVDAAFVSVLVKDDSGDVFFQRDYTMTADLTSFSAYQYCFYPIVASHDLVATEVPMPILGTLEVTLSGIEDPAIGHVVCGRTSVLGKTKYGAEVGETDYSRKETDEFGATTFIRRASASNMSLPLYLHPDQSDAVKRILTNLRATPALWVGDNRDEGFEALTIWGWKEEHRLVYAGPNEMEFKLDIQGLI